MTATYRRTLHRFIPTHFALRTLCPIIYNYAKNTGWPSSYAQLLRDRRVVNASLKYFYASLWLSRLRSQAAVTVKTTTFEATVYDAAKRTVPVAPQPLRREATTPHLTAACDKTPGSADSGSTCGSLSSAPVRDGADGMSAECPQMGEEAAQFSQTTTSAAGQFAAGSLRTPALAEDASHLKKKVLSKEFLHPVHYLKKRIEAALRFAAVLYKFSRETPAGGEAAARGAIVREDNAACPHRYKPRERRVTEQPFRDLGEADRGTQWLFFIHGGGFVMGSPQWYRLLINDLSVLTGAKVFCPKYRLAPESRWPAQLIDCRAAYEHLCRVEGVKGENIIVIGDSAGGNLAIALVMSVMKRPFCIGKDAYTGAERAEGEHFFLPVPAGLVLISPWLDLSMKGPSYVLNRVREPVLPLGSIRRAASLYLHGHFEGGRCAPVTKSSMFHCEHTISYGCRTATNPWVSPIYAQESTLLAHMPPTLIHVGSLEVLLSDSLIFARRVNEAVGGAPIPCQPWSASDEDTYENTHPPPSTAKPPASLARYLSGNGRCSPSYGKTHNDDVKQNMTHVVDTTGSRANAEFVEASCGVVGVGVADPSSKQSTRRCSPSHGEPGYFKLYGWLGETDIRTMNGVGAVYASGCTERDRVQVKVWKDEFHGFPCCGFLEAPNGEWSLLEIASWARKRLAEAPGCGKENRLHCKGDRK